jgi:CheY-like chemotaxis protein
VIQTVDVRAVQKELPLRLEIDSSVPELVQGDPTRVLQVLLNLAGNAVKFTAQGEVKLTLSSPRLGFVRIEVRDTGIGISREKLPKLFEVFTQGDGSISRRFGGTGLGLAISRKLAEHMGGSLTVVSEEGVGSCFTLELPLASDVGGVPRPSAKLSASSFVSRMLRVLVAEDNPINALVARTLLLREGHEVVLVGTGLGAVEASASSRFDLVLMDMQMPELDGLEATRRIRERESRNGGHLPICALTANAMKGDIDRCLAAGMDDYLAKPVELAALRLKLAALGADNDDVPRAVR